MERIGLTAVWAAAMMLGGIAVAHAADIEAADPVYDWSGFYVGGHFGYGGVDTDGQFDLDDEVNNDLGDFDAEGILGGAQAGWNWQTGDWVFGIEGDISAVDWDSSAQDLVFDPGKVTLEFDFLATLRGRLGWAVDNVLLYLTGGVAFQEGEFADPEEGGKEEVSAVGGAVGGGAEWGVTENLTLKAEGLYLFFDDETDLGDLPTADPSDSLQIENGFVVRAGANFLLNLP
jgi:outer membrane immunogenic protein